MLYYNGCIFVNNVLGIRHETGRHLSQGDVVLYRYLR